MKMYHHPSGLSGEVIEPYDTWIAMKLDGGKGEVFAHWSEFIRQDEWEKMQRRRETGLKTVKPRQKKR